MNGGSREGLKGLKDPFIPMCKICNVLQELQSKKDFPADVEGSRRLIDEHTQLKKKVRELQKHLEK